MLFTIYTKFLNEPTICHGAIECDSEFDATIYAYRCAMDIFSQHGYEDRYDSYESYHEALFDHVEFWIE